MLRSADGVAKGQTRLSDCNGEERNTHGTHKNINVS